MGIVEFANSPWGQNVPIHIAFYLIWVSAIAGLAFFIVHAIWVRYFAKKEEFAPNPLPTRLPAKVERHSLAARLFHWIMAASMLALLITAFLPRVGVRFPWVTYHWIAGLVLTASIIFHIIHATFYMDPWSIWPDKTDIEDAANRLRRALGQSAPPPRRFAKYPLENKMYHAVIVLAGLSATLTGIFMMFRVRTGILPRNPYLFGDMTWGMMYVLHGLAGVGLIALVMVHVYFAIRPEKLEITKSMIFGDMSREHYLEHHDPRRWEPEGVSTRAMGAGD
ncbi:MAG TPA: cytochrome b/b6 domain-containing protein [Bryobacteraceae bacterium]|jgi:cytochrome b subunit of formate dehydrogenase|nr:cytochrome b/b6 domain-containing protein [Bryobacteraceae bacterium]